MPDTTPLFGYIHVSLNGPFVTLETGNWDELKVKLKRLGFGIIEDRPSLTGANTKRVSRVPSGPKPKKRKSD